MMCFNRSIHINYGLVLSTNLYGSRPILADFDPCHIIPQDVPRFRRYTSTTYRHNRFSPGSDKSRSVTARFEPETRLGIYMTSLSLWRSLFPKRDQTNQYDSVHPNRITFPAVWGNITLRRGDSNWIYHVSWIYIPIRIQGHDMSAFTGYPTIWINLTGYPTLCSECARD